MYKKNESSRSNHIKEADERSSSNPLFLKQSFHSNNSKIVNLPTSNQNNSIPVINSYNSQKKLTTGDFFHPSCSRNRNQNIKKENTMSSSSSGNFIKLHHRIQSYTNGSEIYNPNRDILLPNFSARLITKDEFNCEENCQYFNQCVKYENVLKELATENNKLKHINKYLLTTIERKDEYISFLMKENSTLVSDINLNKKVKLAQKAEQVRETVREVVKEIKENSQREVIRKESIIMRNSIRLENQTFQRLRVPTINEAPTLRVTSRQVGFNKLEPTRIENNKLRDPIRLESQKESPNVSPLRTSILKNSSHTIKFENKDIPKDLLFPPKESTTLTNIMTNLVSNNLEQNYANINLNKLRKSFKPITHYEEILDIFNRKRLNRPIRETRTSFLSMNEEVLQKIITGDLIREIKGLTNNDEEFVYAMRTYPDDKLTMFNDILVTLIKDYEYSVNLIKRIKSFLGVTVRVVNTMILEDAIDMIIKNSCEILICDRTSIFVHDRDTDMLVIHTGLGLKKGEWRVKTTEGIVGFVFMSGEKQKVDDAYLDDRFNREIDKKTNYKTKTLLCIPLKDEFGACFGVIQAINKKNGLFSSDDEELMEIFANQASSILKNSMKFDENLSFISRLKMLVNFSIECHNCENYFDFTDLSETLLMKFWSSNLAHIVVVKNDKFYHYDNDQIKQKPTNIGIIGKVFAKKEMIAVNSGYENGDFNNLVDIECGFSLVTFPILDNKEYKNVLAIVQVAYPYPISRTTNQPKQIDSDVVNFYCTIASLWLTRNYDKEEKSEN